MSGADRLDWILADADAGATQGSEPLAARYDEWAATYDDDHDDWGWAGPDAAVRAWLDGAGLPGEGSTIGPSLVLDAGCGTGRVGDVVHALGHAVRILGIDFSRGMLDVASKGGHYEQLLHASLSDVPLATASVDAVISTGVFTHGHVGSGALREIVRITRPGGVIVLTMRLDVIDRYQPTIDALCRNGSWIEVQRSLPVRLHPDHNDIEQLVIVWRVTTA